MKRISILFFLIISLFIPRFGSLSFDFEITDILHKADSLYVKHNFEKALQNYLLVYEQDNLLKKDPKLNFKIGYSYYKIGEYEEAISFLNTKQISDSMLPEYTEYFNFRSVIKLNSDYNKINWSGIRYLNKYSKHYLADSVRYLMAEFYFKNGEYSSAYDYYSILSRKKSKKFRRPLLSKQMALCKYELNEKLNSIARIKQILTKYPSSNETLELVNFLEQKKQATEDMFFLILDVYFQHRQFDILTKKLETFIRSAKDEKKKEKARFYLLKMYFSKSEYKSALYGFQNLLKNLKNQSLKSHILIYIARSYLRIGEKEKSAQTYIKYSNLFPRRRLAVECAWKAAWLYEELKNLNLALNQYRAIQRHWPRSSYKYEAKFREGFTLYRMMRYIKAKEIFHEISNSNWNNGHKDRAKYWLAKTYSKLSRDADAFNTMIDLGSNLIETYYATKAFLLHKSYIDSMLQVEEKLARKENPLEQHFSFIALNVEKYERLFQIYELLGKEFVLSEISGNKYKPKDLPAWITMAEVYKKVGDYNGAFKIYDLIDYTYFGETHWLDKPYLLKEKYPFYFDTIIEEFCLNKGIEKNFVLAIIREESGFDKNAKSWADAYGLMQIIPRTAKTLSSEIGAVYSSPSDLYDEKLNLELGIHYISKLSKKFQRNKDKILAAYNAGPHRVKRWQSIIENNSDCFVENIEFEQTRNYVKKVMKNYWIYALLNGEY